MAITATILPFPLIAFSKHKFMTDHNNFDVIIIGGSYAGLSAALALGRSLRKVLIIDSGKPCNIQTPHSQNFLTQDGKAPSEIARLAIADVEKYDTVKFYKGLATIGVKTAHGFEITTHTKDKFTARKLIFATGIKDMLPEIKGFAACWGISIVHCPYCHGFEHRSKNTGIIANGPKAYHLATMVNNLTKNLTILTNGKADFTAEQMEKLKEHHIKIIENQIAEIDHQVGKIKNLIFEDGNKAPFDVIYGVVPFTQHSDIPVSLGCELTEEGYIKIAAFQKTTVPDIYACGDNSNMLRSVANAVASGNIAGAVANGELVHEQF